MDEYEKLRIYCESKEAFEESATPSHPAFKYCAYKEPDKRKLDKEIIVVEAATMFGNKKLEALIKTPDLNGYMPVLVQHIYDIFDKIIAEKTL